MVADITTIIENTTLIAVSLSHRIGYTLHRKVIIGNSREFAFGFM